MHTSTILRFGRSFVVPSRPRPLKAMATSPICITAGPTFFLDPFAVRQWDDPEYKGTRLTYDKVAFLEKLHELYDSGVCELKDGYASFCKHLFVQNFDGARTGTISITDVNRHLLRSRYTRRRPEEIAVLTRWFPKEDVDVPGALYLDVILYSRDQIVKESQTLDGGKPYSIPDIPWGVISVKAQMEDYETPMQPITIMRNALGTEHGGSGVPLNVEAYNASVTYWETHGLVM